MLPITCEEEAREGSREELIGTSAVVILAGMKRLVVHAAVVCVSAHIPSIPLA
jgi:hypothetical protein